MPNLPPAVPDDVLPYSRVLVQSDDWLVGIPLSPHAMFWWGAFTEWCTAHDSALFNEYNQRGALIVFRSMTSAFKWMLHAATGEFRNCDNRVVSWRGFLMRHPELTAQLMESLGGITCATCDAGQRQA